MNLSATTLTGLAVWLNVCGPRVEPLSAILVEDHLPYLVTGKWMAFDGKGDRLAVCYNIPHGNAYLSTYRVSDAKLVKSVELGDKSTGYKLSHPAPFGPDADWVAYPEVDEMRFLPLCDKPAPAPVVVRPKEFLIDQDVYISAAKDKAFIVEILQRTSGFRVREFNLNTAAKQKPVVTELPGRGTKFLNLVTSFAFDPAKRLLAAGFDDDDNTNLEIWTIAEKPEVVHGRTRRHAVGLAFSPKDPVLAAGFGDGTVELFDTATAKPLRERVQLGNRSAVSFSFHPSGKYLACGTNDSRGHPNLYFIEVGTGKVVAKLAATNKGVGAVAFDAAGDRVAVLGGGGVIKIFDARAILKLDKK